MAPTAVFVVIVFLYSLISRRLERTVITAPIVFTTMGLIVFLTPPGLGALELNRKAFLWIAEIGLVMTLFTEAADINLQLLRRNRYLLVRLLSAGMLLTILLGVIVALFVVGGLLLWE
ncbi:MAG TPA: hypothetical protein VNT76_00005, partial [Candidatus Binatus sp.]|nr:hypothetical protein [Candidatus Binatus sp.]